MSDKKINPPRFAKWFLFNLAFSQEKKTLIGDMEEYYDHLHETSGKSRANIWYWKQVISSVPFLLAHSLYWSLFMFAQYLKTGSRAIRKNKVNSAINVLGLALGTACSILIFLHVQYELSYEDCFSKADRIYRLTNHRTGSAESRNWAVVSPVHAAEIAKDIPEIETTVRLFQINSQILMRSQQNKKSIGFSESGGFYADGSFVDIFELEFLQGDPGTALSKINSIVLTEKLAYKYFGEDDPVGQTMSLDFDTLIVTVTGVIREIPDNSHLKLDYLISMPTFFSFLTMVGMDQLAENRGWASVYTYLLLKENSSIEEARAKLPDFTVRFVGGTMPPEEILASTKYNLQPISEIHLHSSLEEEISPNSSISYIYIFLITGIAIIFIASVNSINIAVSQALKRIREIGIRKTLGAEKSQLIKQILGESLMISFLAAIISLSILYIVLPYYSSITGKVYDIMLYLNSETGKIFLLVFIATAFISGFYPALFLAGFQPSESLKGDKTPRTKSAAIRKGLVIFQFAASILLIFSTLVIVRQIDFFKSKDLGFDKKQLIAVKLTGQMMEKVINDPEFLSNQFHTHPGIQTVTMTSNIPGENFSVEPLFPQDYNNDYQLPQMRMIRGDVGYLKAMSLRLVSGSDFSEVSSEVVSFILSEKAVSVLELEAPLGMDMRTYFGHTGKIVGIVKDFHHASLHEAIEPVVIEFNPIPEFRRLISSRMLVKYDNADPAIILESLKEKFAGIDPNLPFIYTFVEDDVDRLYASEEHISSLFKVFALFATFISCLGLFGLSSYSAELRVKEICIRKIHGATLLDLVYHLSKEYIFWIGLALAIALPLGWFLMQMWLTNFAFQVAVDPMLFIYSALLAVVITQLSVSYKSFKAATRNPVDLLKVE